MSIQYVGRWYNVEGSTDFTTLTPKIVDDVTSDFRQLDIPAVDYTPR